MYIKSFRVQNFRRLKDVRVALDDGTTIFVGANNSGKTSATHVFQRFLDSKARFQIHDFTADCWDSFNKLGESTDAIEITMPKIYFDLWLQVDDANVHRVVELLPSLDWNGEPVGIRMVYAPKDAHTLLGNYREARRARRLPVDKKDQSYQPWPKDLTDYLDKRLNHEYEVQHYILDARMCDDELNPKDGYEPFHLGDGTQVSVLSELIRVDFLNAQRHLTDSESHGRAEDLSRRLSRYYQRNLQKFEADLDALSAIADSELALNDHFAQVFDSILKSIHELGYPGITNPGVVIRASFEPYSILSSSAKVHYALPDLEGAEAARPTLFLPDQYNGLGFKNLIYMAVEVLDFHHAWTDTDDRRPAVHLIMIEEPEAHLHAQLQQVFIRKVFELLPKPDSGFNTQMVVTTHSSHILHERSFQPIRYFCRSNRSGSGHHSDVKNLSVFYRNEEVPTREFLQQYLKLTHCDLFFADAAVLVEGNVERLLLPLIIERNVPELRACHLTILEVGGAFAHKFQELLEFLEIPTLVITDLDSVKRAEQDAEDDGAVGPSKTCMTSEPGAATSNETLKQWFPASCTIADLNQLPATEKIVKTSGGVGNIRVAYQTPNSVTWASETMDCTGRTLEEAFALQNLAWTQDQSRISLGLVIRSAQELSLSKLHERIHLRVRDLDKTKFALGLVADYHGTWQAPHYIVDGLLWLRDRLQIAPTLQQAGEAESAK